MDRSWLMLGFGRLTFSFQVIHASDLLGNGDVFIENENYFHTIQYKLLYLTSQVKQKNSVYSTAGTVSDFRVMGQSRGSCERHEPRSTGHLLTKNFFRRFFVIFYHQGFSHLKLNQLPNYIRISQSEVKLCYFQI